MQQEFFPLKDIKQKFKHTKIRYTTRILIYVSQSGYKRVKHSDISRVLKCICLCKYKNTLNNLDNLILKNNLKVTTTFVILQQSIKVQVIIIEYSVIFHEYYFDIPS